MSKPAFAIKAVETVRPETETQLADFLAWAYAEGCAAAVAGGGSKTALGRPMRVDKRLDLSALAGIRLYQPEELVMTAAAGTPLGEIEAALAAKDQRLAFEPPDWSGLLGGEPGRGSIAGTFSVNLSGPRRFQAGAARDHLLGFRAVNGRGEVFRSGGRVVKNVSGYDLCKLICGAFGTLAVLTETTFKVLPRAAGERTILIPGLAAETASAAMIKVLRTPLPITGLSYLPADSLEAAEDSVITESGESWLAARLEAPGQSLDTQCRDAARALGHSANQILDEADSAALWRWVGAAAMFAGSAEDILWRASLPPARWPEVVAGLAADMPIRYICDWGGGLLWIMPAAQRPEALGADGGAARIRRAVAGDDPSQAGHAMLVRGPEPLRAETDVFQPEPEPLARLTRKIKRSFDPLGILNPGRMYRGV